MQKEIKIRAAQLSDAKQLFEWANDFSVRKNAFSQEEIKWNAHCSWLKNRIESPYSKIFIFSIGCILIGQVRFDFGNGFWTIDYSIDKKFRGNGYGSEIINLGINEFQEGSSIRAFVQESNIVSNKVFQKVGFTLLEKAVRNERTVYVWEFNIS